MRGRRRRRFGKPARLERHDRLGAGKRPGGRHELAGLADRLDVEDDRPRFGRRAEVVDQVAHVHVEHVADGDEIGEADPLVDGPVQHRGAQRPRLGNEPDLTLLGGICGETGVQANARNDESQAVGAEDPHAVELGLLFEDFLLQLSAFLTDLAKAGGNDYDAARAHLAARANQRWNGRGGSADHGQVGSVRETGHIRDKLRFPAPPRACG